MRYSKHAIAQFKVRFPDHVFPDQADIVSFHNAFARATENRSFINNTQYMVYMLEKYGDCDCTFYENGDMLFIVRTECVVTVVDRTNTIGKESVFRKADPSRFRK